MSRTEFFEIKKLLLEQKKIQETLFPNKVSISFIKKRTGLTRQGIRDKLINNFQPEVDFWQEGGKIFMSKSVALQLLNLIGD